MHILLVDDEPLVLDTLAPFLERCGHQVRSCANSAEALSCLHRDGLAIDLLISDVCMPGADGTQLLAQVRESQPDVDVILITGHSQIDNLRQAMEHGAAGFLRKPIKLNELRVLIDRVGQSRSDRTKVKRMAVRLDRMSSNQADNTRERMFARRLHQRIFPRDLSWLPHCEAALRHLPQAGLGGDYLDIRPYGEERIALIAADVSGHGLAAAFGGIALKTWFSSLELGLEPATILQRADRLMEELFAGEYYATAFCAIYTPHSRELSCASAGHPQPLILSTKHAAHFLDCSGPPLGIRHHEERTQQRLRLASDEVLLAYSDGLFAQEPTVESLTPLASLLRAPGVPLNVLLTGVLDLATTADPLRAFADDVSLLALRPQLNQPQTIDGLRGCHIMHIEDDAQVRDLVKIHLQELGCLTAPCGSLAEARHHLEQWQPDMVLLDMVLPDGLGHAFLGELRKKYPHMPVVIISGGDLDRVTRQCLEFNPAGILGKPIDGRDLEQVLLAARSFDPDRSLVQFESVGNEWFDFVISSSPSAVDLLTRYLAAIGRQPLPEAVLEDVLWCIREMAMNGIEWGNRFDPQLQVRVSTLILPDRVVIKIADHGNGFDTHRLFDPFDPLVVVDERERRGKRPGGFGLTLVQERMDRVTFNAKGNVALLVKLIPT